MNPYKIPAYQQMDSRQKIAIILIALGDKIAAEILYALPAEDRPAIEESIKNLNYVPQHLIAQCIHEFHTKMDSGVFSGLRGGEGYLKKISLHEIHSPEGKNVDFLHVLNQADPFELAHVLQKENPRTCALILSTVEPHRASKIISEMPLEKQAQVILAFIELERLDQKSLINVLEMTELALEIPLNNRYRFLDSAGTMLESLSSKQQNAILDKLEEMDFDAAESIGKKIFIFNDIQYLNRDTIQIVCQHANPLDLRLAFYDKSEELKNAFFAHISQKEMESLDRQLAQLDSITDASIQEAQHNIIELLHQLEKEHKINRETIALQKTLLSQKHRAPV